MNEEVKYVGFWARFVATILDNIWLAVVIYGLLWLLIGSDAFSIEAEFSILAGFILYVLPFILVIVFWKLKSATPAKMLFKMKIVDAGTLEPVSTLRLIVRYFGYIISLIPLGLGFIWIAFDKKKQGFHDKIAKTVLVKT